MSIKHLNIIVSGKVQGVFYRDYIKRQARKLGIFGFVKNIPDGTVYIEAEGIDPALDRFVVSCKNGSTGSAVSDVTIEEQILTNFSDFKIL